jgi:hypothetical protein
MEEEQENKKDPFSEVRKILYSQAPETREAEIRAEKNRSKATAFLQAFGSLADAFTITRGGDVVKRDLNPYVFGGMQKAEAMKEQDRADKKAWENSWLNLANGIAQYNIRQREIADQREWENEKILNSQEFQKEMGKTQYDRQKEMDETRLGYNKELAETEHGYRKELIDKEGEIKIGVAKAKPGYSTKSGKSGGRHENHYLYITDPDNPAKLVGIDESITDLLFAAALQDRKGDDDIRELIRGKSNNASYTIDEKKRYVALLAKKFPHKIIEYLGEQKAAAFSQTSSTSQTPSTATPDQSFVGPPQYNQYNMPKTDTLSKIKNEKFN